MKPSIRKPKTKALRRWHKKLGLFSAFFLLMITLTGVLINHSHHLSLDSMPVKHAWLLDWYGIGYPKQVSIFSEMAPVLAATDNLLWQDQEPVLEAAQPILSALRTDDKLLATDGQILYWLSPNGQLLEKQDSSMGLPASPSLLGTDSQGNIWLQADDGTYISDEMLLEWQDAATPPNIQWAQPQTSANTQELADLARGTHLSWERMLLDLHSGRLFGAWAIWFWDLIALVFVMLAVSGIWIWLKNGNGREK
ncbi:PepSY-associated TM helix domain-containing protein [Aliiglaciecola sp. CAU 1673]|uniref:PepSY-associated TM helix domain-containing protein n=1 Tax=Aliiglaciecola sp. CAU 1673 TaxID=3032595 RepID=UPI0023DBE0F1|nr:PepSY-associated TM helix domain-containing protein [Aliiglaciecola sp. CAU 1673]MDF2178865.1 PepSY-associated TM helix domain-containing protein [Aliiglaciecola sp. CAU 1673]